MLKNSKWFLNMVIDILQKLVSNKSSFSHFSIFSAMDSFNFWSVSSLKFLTVSGSLFLIDVFHHNQIVSAEEIITRKFSAHQTRDTLYSAKHKQCVSETRGLRQNEAHQFRKGLTIQLL